MKHETRNLTKVYHTLKIKNAQEVISYWTFLKFTLSFCLFDFLGFARYQFNLAAFALGSNRSHLASSFLEFFHAAGRVHEFLFASVKRMASTAKLYRYRFFSGAGIKSIAASASYLGISVISWMEVFFHVMTIL